jgi:C4-dicarboxylate transporter, DctM subunit
MSAQAIALLSLVPMLLLIWAGMHVAVALGLVSFGAIWLIRGDALVSANLLAQAASDAIASHVFGLVPLFVLTGLLVAEAGIGKDAFEVANHAFRRVRGGIGVATVAANAVFAAITGISIASAAVFSKIAVPEMLRFGYSARFATGVVAGSSVLGMLIPPSLLFILYGFLTGESVGALFTAGIVPGIVLAVAFSVYILLAAVFKPALVFDDRAGPAAAAIEHVPLSLAQALRKLLPSALFIGLVLGGIYAGWFTATEAGAVGAALALAFAFGRGKLGVRQLHQILLETGRITVSVCFLIICANIYMRMIAMSGAPQLMLQMISGVGESPLLFLAIYLGFVLLLGTIIDSSSILLIAVPLALPVVQHFGMNPIWFGVITVVAVEVGLLTPPFGLSVFVIKSTVSAQDISLEDIFKGAMPFVVVMMLVLALLIAYPRLSLLL